MGSDNMAILFILGFISIRLKFNFEINIGKR